MLIERDKAIEHYKLAFLGSTNKKQVWLFEVVITPIASQSSSLLFRPIFG